MLLLWQVFGLGNKTYEHYQAAARYVDKALADFGAHRLADIGEGDDSVGYVPSHAHDHITLSASISITDSHVLAHEDFRMIAKVIVSKKSRNNDGDDCGSNTKEKDHDHINNTIQHELNLSCPCFALGWRRTF